MITNTFLHIKGISKRQEQALWAQGVTDWTRDTDDKRLARYTALDDSRAAFTNGDAEFFAKALPKVEHYRIALAFPKDVLFVRVETTGSSLYYDSITMIGWSLGAEYHVFVEGEDPSEFCDAVFRAKAIVTFNGTLHDCKFIHKRFPDLLLPSVHLDLRYCAKRVGFSGGRQAIEQAVGLVRLRASESPAVLWHRYRRGDKAALRRMITGNHADIEAQKVLLDACVGRMYSKFAVPEAVRSTVRFSDLASVIRWAEKGRQHAGGIHISSYAGAAVPSVTFETLNKECALDEACVVGIDLVASEKRSSGYCVLRGNVAQTQRLKTDEEMIDAALSAGATLVSIDSPLGIPHGRTSFWDDDPMREQFGITRECERLLKQRGISVYPCLIPSMQKLTQRGMTLAEKFKACGVEVIEGYPGGTQDVLSIPRKQAGLGDLIEGLKEFGLTGDFEYREFQQPGEGYKKNVSSTGKKLDSAQLPKITHDELDAVTSALVGLFYLCGKYEALGNTEEGLLILPSVEGGF